MAEVIRDRIARNAILPRHARMKGFLSSRASPVARRRNPTTSRARKGVYTLRRRSRPYVLPPEEDVRFVLFGRAWSIQWNIGWSGTGLSQMVGNEVMFHFFAADISEHDSVDFYAGRKWLTTLLFHFPSECRILYDVLFFVRQTVLFEHCPDTVAPAAGSFEIGHNLRFIHNVGSNVDSITDCCNKKATCADRLGDTPPRPPETPVPAQPYPRRGAGCRMLQFLAGVLRQSSGRP